MYDQLISINGLFEKAVGEVLDPSTMSALRVERESIDVREVFYNRKICESLHEYRKRMKFIEEQGKVPSSVARINRMTVPDGYMTPELLHQDVTGKQLEEQIRLIKKAPFLRTITSHPDYNAVSGFEQQRKILNDTSRILNFVNRIGNLFRKEKIRTMRGSEAEMSFAYQCFGVIWPAGINLYSILREMYPAFHARLTGQIPLYLAEHLNDLLEAPVCKSAIRGIGRFTVDEDNRFLGLYPVIEVPADQFTSDTQYVSQDQLGRRALANMILEDAIKVLQIDKDKKIVVIDYAGGVGNISELLLRQIFTLPQGAEKTRLMDQLRIVVTDIEDDQLAAGKNRFEQMNHQPGLKGISDKILFTRGDVTKPLSERQIASIKEKFGKAYLNKSIYLGMTAYTLGALDKLLGKEKLAATQMMADELVKQCWKIYAVDFSSPLWRLEGFKRDTARWGKEYLRSIHGSVDEKDKNTSLNTILAKGLQLRYGLRFTSVADFVRFVALGPGLASHYMTVWPGSDGHNSGYTIQEDGTLKMPSILSFAEHLKNYGMQVNYKSKVWLFGTSDLGRTTKRNRAWMLIPGWVADFVMVENLNKSPFVSQFSDKKDI